jgi:hypothetical protein
MLIRHILLAPVVCLAVPYFSTIFHKWHSFRENVTQLKMCVLIFSTTLSEIFLIIRRTERNMILNARRSLRRLSAILL